jgi:hypothetical protein
MRLVTTVFTLAIALGSAAIVSAAGPVPDLRITEILAGPARDWDGSGTFSSRDDEWIEIMNGGAGDIDLSGFYVTDRDSTPRCGLSGTLAPGERRVIFGKTALDWERAAGFPALGLALNNTGDAVLLWHAVGVDSVLVDGYTFRSHEAAADRAVGRADDAGDWTLYDGLNPYTGTIPPFGTGCAPSPMATNACTPTGVERLTWGRLKTRYR